MRGSPPSGLPLLCLPSAGGASTSYRGWQQRLAPDILAVPVELPGRGGRFAEPCLTSVGEVADALTSAVEETFRTAAPIALFGHSMGATLAFECARRLDARGRTPVALILSGRAPNGRVPEGHLLADEPLVALLRALGGVPQPVLDSPELVALMLPVLRRDFAMLAAHVQAPEARLHLPILAVGGDSDPVVSPAELVRWGEATDGPFETQIFPGGHFYWANPEPLLRAIADFLGHHMPTRA